jgi:hypothetical protein
MTMGSLRLNAVWRYRQIRPLRIITRGLRRDAETMQCPKCKFDSESQTTECLKCGIVFAKYYRLQERPQSMPTRVEAESEDEGDTADEAKRELRYRVFALPLALLAARCLVGTFPGLVRLLTMWVHEAGHAVTAWLCGFWAVPGPWVTPVSDERSLSVMVLVLGAVGFGGFQVWNARRWTMVGAGVAVLIFQLVCTLLPFNRAQALIIFGGDAGCMVLGSILMITFYARRESPIYQNSLRWGFLVIGAAAFMDAFTTWTGAEDDIPFGTQEGTLTDPSSLVQTYGWPIHVMMQRYVRLGVACIAALAITYVFGILCARSTLNRMNSNP